MITRSDEGDLGCTLKLEGKHLGPWAGELEPACGGPRIRPDRVRLDLAGLTFVDAEATRFLEALLREGTWIVACSGFVAEMLHHPGA
jgi:hypothetical protein